MNRVAPTAGIQPRLNRYPIRNKTTALPLASVLLALTAAIGLPAQGQGISGSQPALQSQATSDPQSAPNSQQTSPTPTAQTPESQQLQEIQVTGTRIEREGYNAPTPLTVLSNVEINQNAPVNIADYVNQLPQFAGSVTPHNSNLDVSDANNGVNNLNLRSLGPNRTLVLFDGVRVVGSSISGFAHNGGSVDTNSFPDALVERVDVVTGGASAVYGSDAISGVVNFVLNKKFQGVKGSFQGGITQYGDDAQFAINLTGGTGFADDKGHVLLSLSDNYVNGIPHANRPWNQNGWQVIANPNYTPINGQPQNITLNHVGLSLGSFGGLVIGCSNAAGPLAVCPLGGIDFGPGGIPRVFNFGAINNGFVMQGGDWRETDASQENTLDSRISRQNLFSYASYDLTDNANIYAQFMYAITSTSAACCSGFDLGNITVTQANPFLRPDILAQMTATGVTSLTIGSLEGDQPRLQPHDTRRFNQYVIGSDGKFTLFGSNWTSKVYATISVSNLNARATQNEISSYFQNAVDAIRDPVTGAPICRIKLTDPNTTCAPWNPMGLGVNSQAALNYVIGTGILNQKIQEDAASASMTGEPFSDWAGPVSVATGVEYRNESVGSSTTPLDEANDFFAGNYHATSGSYHVTEGFVETVVPLAKDMMLARQLDLNAAVRATDYSTSGYVTTWKIGATWTPINDIRFRATHSRDIRAPNLGELYSRGQSGTSTITDPFKGNAVFTVNSPTVGNTALEPEIADTNGFGVVFQPTFFPHFIASIDYYHIKIGGAISTLSGQQELNDCFAGQTSFCPFIVRNPAGIVTLIYVKPANVLAQTTSGFDIESTYTQPLSELVSSWGGQLTARLLTTHVIHLSTDQPDGTVVDGAGVNNQSGTFSQLMTPSWRYYLTLSYENNPFMIAFTARGLSDGVQDSTFIQCASGCPAATVAHPTIDNNHLPGAFYMDLSLSYKISPAELFVTVENLANRDPGLVPGLGGLGFVIPPTDPVTYDVLGRTYRAGVRFSL
jgi:outer membrane receptor protein involved in Fe transport